MLSHASVSLMLRGDANYSGAFHVHFQTSVPLVNKIGKQNTYSTSSGKLFRFSRAARIFAGCDCGVDTAGIWWQPLLQESMACETKVLPVCPTTNPVPQALRS